MNRATWLKLLPKVELHCHLDGSLPPELMRDYLAAQHLCREGEAVRFSVSEDCRSLADYLAAFQLPVRCLQTEEAISGFLRGLLREAGKENVFYLEVRFSPKLLRQGGLTYEQVFSAIAAGKAEGERESGVRSGVIVCAMREDSVETNLEMLEAALPWYPTLVSALDLAGAEAIHSTREQRAFFDRAREEGIPFTIHSGETGRVDNLQDALDYGAARVGHGIALQKSPELLSAYASVGIGVELCPLSNLQTKAVERWEDYPLQRFLAAGLPVSVNTDNRTVSDTTLTEELERLAAHCGMTAEQAVGLMRSANEMSFATGEVKESFEGALSAFLRRCPISELEDWA